MKTVHFENLPYMHNKGDCSGMEGGCLNQDLNYIWVTFLQVTWVKRSSKNRIPGFVTLPNIAIMIIAVMITLLEIVECPKYLQFNDDDM